MVFNKLKEIVDTVSAALKRVVLWRHEEQRNSAALTLIQFHIALSDILRDGRRFLRECGNRPLAKLALLDDRARDRQLRRWANFAMRQGHRLYWVAGRLAAQDALSVIDPDLSHRVDTIAGSKSDRVKTLGGIVAGLVVGGVRATSADVKLMIKDFFPVSRSRGSIQVMIDAANDELEQLSLALRQFSKQLRAMMDRRELVGLVMKARETMGKKRRPT